MVTRSAVTSYLLKPVYCIMMPNDIDFSVLVHTHKEKKKNTKTSVACKFYRTKMMLLMLLTVNTGIQSCMSHTRARKILAPMSMCTQEHNPILGFAVVLLLSYDMSNGLNSNAKCKIASRQRCFAFREDQDCVLYEPPLSSKRTAGGTAAARPVKKTKCTVPTILTEAQAALPVAEYLKLLNKNVLPGIDVERSREVFEAIRNSRSKQDVAQQIGFESNKRNINQQQKALEKDIKQNWKDGGIKQAEMSAAIANEVSSWLDCLFKVAVEAGTELVTVQKCLIFVEGHILQLMNNRSRSNYDDCYSIMGYTIESSDGETRYEGPPDTTLPLFWRDLLLMAFIQGDKAVISAFKAHRQKLGGDKKNGTMGEPDTFTHLWEHVRDPEKPSKNPAADDKKFQDQWHTDEMRAAVPELRAMLAE